MNRMDYGVVVVYQVMYANGPGHTGNAKLDSSSSLKSETETTVQMRQTTSLCRLSLVVRIHMMDGKRITHATRQAITAR